MVKSLYSDKMIYRAAEVAWTRGVGGRLSCVEGLEGLWPAVVQRCEEPDCNSRVWAKRDHFVGSSREELGSKLKSHEVFEQKSYKLMEAEEGTGWVQKKTKGGEASKKVPVCCEDEVTKLRWQDFWWTFSLTPRPSAKLALHMPVTGQHYSWTLLLLFQNMMLIQAVILQVGNRN